MSSAYAAVLDEISQLVLNKFRKERYDIAISDKASYDYVTSVDRKLQAEIIQFLTTKFPKHDAFGEEAMPREIEAKDPTWIIDPLDGTSNFIFNMPFVGCSLALISNGEVQVALVIDLIHHEVFTAFRGGGAFLNGAKLDSSECRSDFIGVSTGYLEHLALHDPGYLINLKRSGKFRVLGSQALHLCYVASGRFKACISYEAKLWDDIAGALIVEEAGGAYISEIGFSTRNISVIRTDRDLKSAAFGSNELRAAKQLTPNPLWSSRHFYS